MLTISLVAMLLQGDTPPAFEPTKKFDAVQVCGGKVDPSRLTMAGFKLAEAAIDEVSSNYNWEVGQSSVIVALMEGTVEKGQPKYQSGRTETTQTCVRWEGTHGDPTGYQVQPCKDVWRAPSARPKQWGALVQVVVDCRARVATALLLDVMDFSRLPPQPTDGSGLGYATLFPGAHLKLSIKHNNIHATGGCLPGWACPDGKRALAWLGPRSFPSECR